MKNIKCVYFSFLQLLQLGVKPLHFSFHPLSPITMSNIIPGFTQPVPKLLLPEINLLGVYVFPDEIFKYHFLSGWGLEVFINRKTTLITFF